MRILAIETVDRTGSVAALEGPTLLEERRLEAGRRSGQSLAPAIAALLSQVGWRAADVELLAVASGPGSFTGLRIGITTAKTFAYAAPCELVGVPTLLAIASRIAPDVQRVWVVLDAQRGELFAAEFARTAEGQLSEMTATHVVPAGEWLASLAPGAVGTGPGLERFAERLPEGVIAATPSLWGPTAAAVGKMGLALYWAGQRTTALDLVPRYFRRAAAEEKRNRDISA